MKRHHTGFRRWKNRFALAVMGLMVVLCLVPLVSVSWKLLYMGIGSLNWHFLVSLPLSEPKGVGNAIVGSALILIVASMIAVPLGLLSGLYLSQRGHTHTARVSRLLLDVMAGIPAIVVGMFVYAMIVLPMRGPSLLAAGLSLAIIMVPIIARTSEEALKAIPTTVTEAGLGLGLPRRTVILRILLRSAMPTVLTGFFLSVARVGGEAAPLLFTCMGSNSYPRPSAHALVEQTASLPVAIYELVKDPDLGMRSLAWGASLVLVVGLLAIRVSTNVFIRWRYGQEGVSL